MTGRENTSRSSGSFAVAKRSSTRSAPSANVQTVCVGRTFVDSCGNAGTSAGVAPQRRHVRPSASSSTVIGCFAPDQWVVSTSVSLSAALHTLKNGSTETSGTAGGRKACAAAAQANAQTVKRIFCMVFSPVSTYLISFTTPSAYSKYVRRQPEMIFFFGFAGFGAVSVCTRA